MPGKYLKAALASIAITGASVAGYLVLNDRSQKPSVQKQTRPVTMYIRPTCPYCVRALQFFGGRGVAVRTIDIGEHPDIRKEMIDRSNRQTVPQIFIGETHVGGLDDLLRMEQAGKLHKLLYPANSASSP